MSVLTTEFQHAFEQQISAIEVACLQSRLLPMCRQDIADYLALSSETVSRVLTKLESASAITLRTTRHNVFRDRACLEQMPT